MASSVNFIHHVGYGSKGDIKMSFNQHLEFVRCQKQDQLSNAAVLKFKNLYKVTGYFGLTLFIVSGIPSVAFSRFLIGAVRRRQADLKLMMPAFFTVFPIALYFVGQIQMPRRLYTELLTDDGTDGTEIRSALARDSPALWKELTNQMLKLNYQFPEMPINNNEEIPRALL